MQDGIEIPAPENGYPTLRQPGDDLGRLFREVPVEDGIVLGDGDRRGGGDRPFQSPLCDRAVARIHGV